MNKLLVLFGIAVVLSSCGGGGGGGGGGSSLVSTSSLSAFKGAITNAQCTLADSLGIELVNGSTTTSGSFVTSATLPKGILTLTCVGGEYLDEVTGITKTGTTMRAIVNHTGGDLILTTSPISEAVFARAQGLGGDTTAITTANSDIADELGLEGNSISNLAAIIPTNINNNDIDNNDAGRIALILTAVSQKNQSIVGTDTSSVVDIFVDSLITGTLNTSTFNVVDLIANLPSTLTSKINIDTTTFTARVGGTATRTVIPTLTAINYNTNTFTLSQNEIFSQSPTLLSSSTAKIKARIFTASGLPNGLRINQNLGVISGTPTVTGVFTATVTASISSANSVTNTISFTITKSPLLADTSNVVVVVGTAISPISFTNTGGEVATCNPNPSLPAGLTVAKNAASCTITGTPSTATPSANYTITGTNVTGSDVASVNITVNPRSPLLADTSNVVVVVGTAISPISFTNTGGEVATCNPNPSLPAGLTVAKNAASCTITGTPSTATPSANYTITGTNVTGSDVASVNITVNPRSPLLADTSNVVVVVGTAISPISFTNTGGEVATCNPNPSLPAGLTVAKNAASCTITGTPSTATPSANYTITGTNVTGSDVASVNITVNPRSPLLADTSNVVVVVGTAISPISFTNTGGEVATCNPNPSLPAGLTVAKNAASCTITGTPSTATPSANYTITGTNVTGSDVASVNITVNPRSPLLADTSNVVVVVGTAISPISFTNTGGEVATCNPNPSLPAGLTVAKNAASCTITGTPSTATPSANYTITGTNVTGSDVASVNITVNPRSPLLADTSNVVVVVGTAISPISFTNTGGEVATCNPNPSLPAGLTVAKNAASCTITGTPSTATPSANYTITGTNVTGSDVASVNITVNPRSPLLADTSNVVVVVGTAISPISFTNTGGEVATCNPNPSLPAGLTVAKNAASCTITGTPSTATPSANYTITGTNVTGSDVASVNITVNPRSPLLADTSNVVVVVGTAISPISFTNTGGEVATCNPNPSLPAGLTVAKNAASCTITGTPSTATPSANYTITGTNVTGSDVASVNITVNPRSPLLADTSNVVVVVGTAISPISFTNTGGEVATCNPNPSLPAGLTVAKNAASCTITGTPSTATPSANYTITGTNVTGSDVASVNITVNPRSPLLADTSNVVVVVGTAISPISFTNTGGEVATCNPNPSLPAGLTVAKNAASCTITGTPSTATPSANYTITGTNVTGSDVASVNITVNPRSPLLADTSNVVVVVGTAISPISFTNTGGEVATCNPNPSLPAGLTVAKNAASCTITGTPSTATPSANYTITGTNVTGSDVASVNITVNPRSPLLADTSNVVVVVGTAISPISFTNTGGEVATCNPNPSLPAGLTVAKNAASCTITGTPSTVTPSANYTITGTNVTGSDVASVNITVNPRSPLLADTSNVVVVVGTAISPISFTNTGGEVATCNPNPSLPAGLTVAKNAASCTITGTPSTVTPSANYTITGTNVTGSDVASVNITVNPLTLPNIADAERTSIVINQNITPIVFTNTGGAIASCRVSPSLPNGLSESLSEDNCIISGSTSVVSSATTYTITANNTTGNGIATIRLSTHATSDLVSNQWHLTNTGQTNFAKNGGTIGADINIQGVTYTGNGVIVAVVDGGLEITHEDLVDNVVAGGSRDFVNNDMDPTSSATNGDHGTSVAGIIAARDNNIGPKGVAPNASLKGFNFLYNSTIENQINSLGGASYSQDVSIFNQSYGIDSPSDFRIEPALEDQLITGTTSLRGGKGALYVTSASNGFNGMYVGDIFVRCNAFYSQLGITRPSVTCQNANMDAEIAVPYQIVVGATNANDKKSSYSTAGSNIWVSAPGGESGATNPAILTTDQSGCDIGYSRNDSTANSFETNANSQNPECNYTSTFNGTSSASPVVSGVIALMLEANPALTWRDVKHILANTSEKIDSTIGDVTDTIGGVTYVFEQGWRTNTAGYDFHNWYGFGRVDAGRAVASATTYVANSLDTFSSTSQTLTTSASIPDMSVTGVSQSITIPSSLTIEAVQIDVDITHSAVGNLSIELTSPGGTKSILLNATNIFINDDDLDMVLLSNAFYGEPANGDWTLKVVDTLDADTGTLNNWKLIIYGH